MNRPIAEQAFSDKPDAEAPLDPAVERVRRKLIRFAIINLAILFAALGIVVAALAWRTTSLSRPYDGTDTRIEAQLALPAGARVLSQSLSPDEIALLTEEAGGARKILVFSRSDGRLVGRYAIGASAVPE